MDIMLTNYGNLVVSPTGDVEMLPQAEPLNRQRAAITLYTNAPDFDLFPDFGANLEDLIDRRLDEHTIDLGMQLLEAAFPEHEDLWVIPDHDNNALIFMIRLVDIHVPLAIVFSLDEGLLDEDLAEEILIHALSED